MKIFGMPPIDGEERVPVPVGATCLHCEEPIEEHHFGQVTPHLTRKGWTECVLHWECAARAIIGGLNHQLGVCTCCGGTEEPDPPGMTKREAAVVAFQFAKYGVLR